MAAVIHHHSNSALLSSSSQLDDAFDRTPSLSNSDETTTSDSDYFINFTRSSPSTHLSFGKHNSSPEKPLPITPRQRQKSRAPRRQERSVSTAPPNISLAGLLSNQHVLSRFLDHIAWQDFHALFFVSHELRRNLWRPDLRDIILSHFIPAYSRALRTKDSRFWVDNIHLTSREFVLYMTSLAVPMHQYPVHALSVLSSSAYSKQHQALITRLQIYTQMHSRLVLLLQSMVHSSRAPILYELDDAPSRPAAVSQSNVRELQFPAPLSYFSKNSTKEGSADATQTKVQKDTASDRGRSNSVPKSKLHARHRSEDLNRPALSPQRYTRSRFSAIIGRGQHKVPPPPPLEEPPALREYSSTWKRRYSASIATSDEDNVLRPPSRRFTSANASRSSSIGSTPTQSSIRPASSPNAALSPHDLRMATSRTRAPIIRLFLPCSALSDDVISACEEQLLAQDLWQHLSVGDLICNFGFVPPIEESGDEGIAGGSSETNSLDAMPSDSSKRWLLYTGDRLAPYDPTTPPPIPDPLSLPSPFYYINILPSDGNPRFLMTLPHLQLDLSLSLQSELISSPKSQSGRVRVKQYVWLGSVDVRSHPTMGYGWTGEWVLQGEGTKEGRQLLLETVQGGQQVQREWEIVREKCGNGTLWMKLLATPSHADGLSSQGHTLRIAAA